LQMPAGLPEEYSQAIWGWVSNSYNWE
jgi:hypothetical protein